MQFLDGQRLRRIVARITATDVYIHSGVIHGTKRDGVPVPLEIKEAATICDSGVYSMSVCTRAAILGAIPNEVRRCN